jgi:hypothetical protein
VWATIVTVRHAIAVAVPACMAVVGAAVMTIVGAAVMTIVGTAVVTAVIVVPSDVARWGRRNNDHVRAITAVSMVRLRLCRSTQSGKGDQGCSTKCEG